MWGQYFETEDFRLGQSEGFAVDFYEAFASLSEKVCQSCLLGGKIVKVHLAMGDGGCCFARRLLASESPKGGRGRGVRYQSSFYQSTAHSWWQT